MARGDWNHVLAIRIVIVPTPINAQTIKMDRPAAVLGEKSPATIMAFEKQLLSTNTGKRTVADSCEGGEACNQQNELRKRHWRV
jgi:hypothetical protein